MPRETDGGNEANEDARQHRDHDREKHHPRVERNGIQAWQIGRCNPEENPDAGRPHRKPDGAADERQHDAFRQQLTDHAPAVGAEGFPNGHFPRPDGDPG